MASIGLTYGDSVYINVRDGVGCDVIHRDGWRTSPFLGYTFGHDNDDDLHRLDEVDSGITAGCGNILRDIGYSAAGGNAGDRG